MCRSLFPAECNVVTRPTLALATGLRKTVLGSVVKILIRYNAVPSRSGVTAGPVNAYVTWITQTTIILALSIDAIFAIARAFFLVICDNVIYATLTSFKCFAYTIVTARASGTLSYTYTYAIIATLISGTRTYAYPVITTFTAGACGYTSALVTAFPHLITYSTISVSTTLFRCRVIAGCIVTASLPNGATAHVTIAAITDAAVATAAGFPGFTTRTTTTFVTATMGTAAVLSRITAFAIATSITATVVNVTTAGFP